MKKEQQQKHVCTFLKDEPRILCLMYWRNYSRTSHLHVKITSAIMPRSARSCLSYRCGKRWTPGNGQFQVFRSLNRRKALLSTLEFSCLWGWRLLEGQEWTLSYQRCLKPSVVLDHHTQIVQPELSLPAPSDLFLLLFLLRMSLLKIH